jgi:hypothetical protein
MPIIHRDKGAFRKWTDEDIANMERLNETISQRKIGEIYGVSEKVIQRQLAEHGTPREDAYKPRILAPWPRVNFANDNLRVMD